MGVSLGVFERRLLVAIQEAGVDAYGAELARRMETEQSQVSSTLTRLYRQGLVMRKEVLEPRPRTRGQRRRLVYRLSQLGEWLIG